MSKSDSLNQLRIGGGVSRWAEQLERLNDRGSTAFKYLIVLYVLC